MAKRVVGQINCLFWQRKSIRFLIFYSFANALNVFRGRVI